MNLQSAIIKVLQDAGGPMSYGEITARLIQTGLWRTQAKRPEGIVAARLSVDIKNRGSNSSFVRVERGVYDVRREGGDGQPQSSPTGAADKPAVGSEIVSPSPLSFIQAGEQVLAEFGKGHPMHYREITARALEMGWLSRLRSRIGRPERSC